MKEAQPRYLLREDLSCLFPVTEVQRESKKTITLRLAAFGVKTIRKNGKDGQLFQRRPYGWGVIGG